MAGGFFGGGAGAAGTAGGFFGGGAGAAGTAGGFFGGGAGTAGTAGTAGGGFFGGGNAGGGFFGGGAGGAAGGAGAGTAGGAGGAGTAGGGFFGGGAGGAGTAGGRPGICASPDTPIATPDGDRPIASLHEGDLVYSVDHGAVVVVPIARTIHRAVSGHHVVHLSLVSGAELYISAPHPTSDGRSFGQLRPGDRLDGVGVAAAESVPYPFAFTYDILPDSDTGTYYAGGALIGSTLVPHAFDYAK
jgi:hypothetical protein